MHSHACTRVWARGWCLNGAPGHVDQWHLDCFRLRRLVGLGADSPYVVVEIIVFLVNALSQVGLLSNSIFCNGTTGSDDEGLKPASIFARKTKKDKATAKLTNENGNPSNPFSIETKSEVGGLRDARQIALFGSIACSQNLFGLLYPISAWSKSEINDQSESFCHQIRGRDRVRCMLSWNTLLRGFLSYRPWCAILSQDASATPKKEKANPFAVKSEVVAGFGWACRKDFWSGVREGAVLFKTKFFRTSHYFFVA